MCVRLSLGMTILTLMGRNAADTGSEWRARKLAGRRICVNMACCVRGVFAVLIVVGSRVSDALMTSHTLCAQIVALIAVTAHIQNEAMTS